MFRFCRHRAVVAGVTFGLAAGRRFPSVIIMHRSFKRVGGPDAEVQTKGALPRTKRIVVDSEGIRCPPTPMTDLFKPWRSANLGDTIEHHATNPDIENDVRAWAKKSGNRVLEVSREKGYTRIDVQITKKGKEVAILPAAKSNVNDPDETKVTPKAKLQLVTVGGFTMGLRTLEPGWRWSVHMQPVAKTASCQVRHIGYVVSGRMGFLKDDGTKLEVGPGDVFDIHPGHDTWTMGEASAVFVDMIGAVERQKVASDAG